MEKCTWLEIPIKINFIKDQASLVLSQKQMELLCTGRFLNVRISEH